MTTQAEKGNAFRKLHDKEEAFIIPNPWDAGSAKLAAFYGFKALATTSMGFAFSIGVLDNCVDREQVISHVSVISAATELPVSADLENGFGDTPESAAETIRLAAAAGAVGGSIEDATGRAGDPIYTLGLSVDRIRAAVEAARSLDFTFTLTARAENYLHGRPDLSDTIKRLQAFQEAGADVLYAPGLTTREEIAAVVSSVDRPINVLAGISGIRLNLAELSDLGVKRVSVGGALCRAAVGAAARALAEMRDEGTFQFVEGATPSSQILEVLSR